MAATGFHGLLAVHAAFAEKQGYPGRAAIVRAILMNVVICFSRVYLGLHYLSDVMGGIAEGIAWLALSLTVLHYSRTRQA